MELNNQSIQDREQWSAKGYYIADFNRAAIVEKTAEKPIWVHFGDGNIFRAFIAMLQQNLIENQHQTNSSDCITTKSLQIMLMNYKY